MLQPSVSELTEKLKDCDTTERTEFRVTFNGSCEHFKGDQLSKLDRKLRFLHGKKPYEEDVTIRFHKNEPTNN
jgi:hypothetical protein